MHRPTVSNLVSYEVLFVVEMRQGKFPESNGFSIVIGRVEGYVGVVNHNANWQLMTVDNLLQRHRVTRN